jgi:hypothetical protein
MGTASPSPCGSQAHPKPALRPIEYPTPKHHRQDRKNNQQREAHPRPELQVERVRDIGQHRYDNKMPQARRLRFFNDRHHHLCRLAKENDFLEAGTNPDKSTIHLKIARKHASHFIHRNIKEYSQQFPGKKNNVANALSWDFDLSNAKITEHLRLHYPSQLPPHFQVVPFPREIESWLISLLQ